MNNAQRADGKVSAVIPAFNRAAYICRAIDSVLAQTVPVNEIVVVDDGSTDGTASLVKSRYGSHVRLFSQSQTGVSGARRRGIMEATGEWIAFLDSDDEWTPKRNAELLQAAAAVPQDVAWIFGDLSLVTDEGESKTLFGEFGLHLTESPYIFPDALAVQHPFQFGMFQGSFIRRSALLALDCFSIDLRSDDDLLAGFQVASQYRFAAIRSVVGKYYRTSDLAASSVVLNGVYGPDYYRSRMLAFAAVIESGRRRPWNNRYAAEVRALCKLLATQNQLSRRLPLQQFRYGGFTLKGVAFLLAAILGQRGIKVWDRIAELRRRHLRSGALLSDSSIFSAQVKAAVEHRSAEYAPEKKHRVTT